MFVLDGINFVYSVLKSILKFCFLKSFDIFGDILPHVFKRYSLFIFFFIDAVGGCSLIIFLREWHIWNPNNEEITHRIANFTTIDTNTILSILTVYFIHSLYKTILLITKLYKHCKSYVYWTVHHLNSWLKIDHLDVTCFIISPFTAQHVSNVSTFIFRSLRISVVLSHGLYCSVRIEV